MVSTIPRHRQGSAVAGRRDHFFTIATLLLSVALAKSTAAILLNRTEAAVLVENNYDDFDILEHMEGCIDNLTAADGRVGEPGVGGTL